MQVPTYEASTPPPVSKAQITRQVRSRLRHLLVDDSGTSATEVAIYTLSDPRDIRCVRYVGQTIDPHRRYLQHISQARLWLLAGTAWWIKSPKLRPLSEWVRELYQDEERFPAMVVVAWTDPYDALRAERKHIHRCLDAQLLLLNREIKKATDQRARKELNQDRTLCMTDSTHTVVR